METIFVSRQITFDRRSQPEVLADIERLKAAGFSVFFAEAESSAPTAEKAFRRAKAGPTKEEICAVLDAIRDRQGIGSSRIGALIGATGLAVRNWASGRNGISRALWERLNQLRKRCDRLPPMDSSLVAEARGALRSRRLAASESGPVARISDEVRLQIAAMRVDEGRSLKEVSSHFGVDRRTVHRIVREFYPAKQEA